jgi:regulatory protein
MEDKERKKQLTVLWSKAMSALARREHSAYELRQKLKPKAPADLIDELIESLLKDGLISDERFAHMLCRSRFNRGVGPVRVEYELNKHQVRIEWVEQAIAKYEHQWVDHLQALNARKYGDIPPADYKAWAKRARFFQGRGFTTSQIQQAIPR